MIGRITIGRITIGQTMIGTTIGRRSSKPWRQGSTRRLPGSAGCSTGRTEMAQLVVKVNGREFPLTCADGQETRTRRLAQYVDSKVAEFTKTVGQVGEARLILLAALVIADELSDANEALRQERNRQGPSGGGDPGTASGIRSMAERIESVADRFESP